MYENYQEGGFLSQEAPGYGAAGPVIDPLDAVMALERARAADAAPAAEAWQPRGGEGMMADPRTRADAEPRIAPGEAGPDADYGEFAWPDGFAADPQAMAKFVPLARRLGLSKDSAQALTTLYAELEQARNGSQAEFIARNNAEWLRDIQSHPEFGGNNLRRSSEGVASLMRRFGTPLLTAQMRQMNIQNWPEMFFFLARVAQASSEDCSPSSGAGGAATRSTAQLLFPGLK